jgi:hypothetical protein
MIPFNFSLSHSLTALPPCPSKTLTIALGLPSLGALGALYALYRSSFALRTVPLTLAAPTLAADVAAADVAIVRVDVALLLLCPPFLYPPRRIDAVARPSVVEHVIVAIVVNVRRRLLRGA